MKNKKISLIIGHKATKKGAGHWSGLNEFDFNSRLVEDIYTILRPRLKDNIELEMIFRKNTYKQMVDNLNCHLAIEFHLNAGGGSGTEMLIAKSLYDKKDINKIKNLSEHISDTIGLRNRGIKKKLKGERGFYFLDQANAELAIIAETCFIDNKYDIEKLFRNYSDIVYEYVDWIKNYIEEV